MWMLLPFSCNGYLSERCKFITFKFSSHKIKAKEVLEILSLTLYAIINHPRGFEFYMKVV